MIVVVFRARVRPDCDLASFGTLYEEMYGLVSKLPGFQTVKDFQASDGEVVTIIEFESLAALETWKNHPDHIRAKARGRTEFFSEHSIQICEQVTQYGSGS